MTESSNLLFSKKNPTKEKIYKINNNLQILDENIETNKTPLENPISLNKLNTLNNSNSQNIDNNRYGENDPTKKILVPLNNSYNSNNSIPNVKNDSHIPTEINENPSLTLNTGNNINISNNNSHFFAKVVVEKIPSVKKIQSILENFLNENNLSSQVYVETQIIEPNSIILTFDSENVAFNFTKVLNNYKCNNPNYSDILVHLNLIQNSNYLREKGISGQRKRGLSSETILKLFQGSSYIRKSKVPSKIKSYVNVEGKSPFIFDKKRKQFNENNSCQRLLNQPRVELKRYDILNINVLNTEYKDIKIPEDIHRSVNKERWVCPTDFKLG